MVLSVRQVGRCVWWIALSDFPGEAPGAEFTLTFRGDIGSDFILSGEWAFVVRPNSPGAPDRPNEGRSTFTIEIVRPRILRNGHPA